MPKCVIQSCDLWLIYSGAFLHSAKSKTVTLESGGLNQWNQYALLLAVWMIELICLKWPLGRWSTTSFTGVRLTNDDHPLHPRLIQPGHTEPLNEVKCTKVESKSQRAKNITDISLAPLLHADREQSFSYTWVKTSQGQRVRRLERRNLCLLHFPSLFLGKSQGEDQKKVGLPWVQSSRNYSLTWKRRQLINSGKLSVLPRTEEFLCPLLTSLISALQNMWHLDSDGNLRRSGHNCCFSQAKLRLTEGKDTKLSEPADFNNEYGGCNDFHYHLSFFLLVS